jgi:hypothetical protein
MSGERAMFDPNHGAQCVLFARGVKAVPRWKVAGRERDVFLLAWRLALLSRLKFSLPGKFSLPAARN